MAPMSLLDAPENELGRTVEPGTICASLSSGGGERSIKCPGNDRTMLMGSGGGGKSKIASLFRLPLGVAMTCTPCPNGFRTGFFCFRELPPPPGVVLLSASSAISLATSSRLGRRKAWIAASSSFFWSASNCTFFSFVSCCLACALRSTSRFSTRLAFCIPPRTLALVIGNNGSMDSRLLSGLDGAVLDRWSGCRP